MTATGRIAAATELITLAHVGTCPPPKKNCLFHLGIMAPFNTWFPGPTRVHISNDISTGLVFLPLDGYIQQTRTLTQTAEHL